MPVWVVAAGTFKTTPELFSSPYGLPSSLSLDNNAQVREEAGLAQAFVNSVVVTVCSVFLTLLVASLAAYGIARIPGWKGLAIFGFLVLGMVCPSPACGATTSVASTVPS